MSRHLVTILIGAFLLAGGASKASYAGPQKDAVCGGSCGGGCGACPGQPNNQPRGPRRYTPAEIAAEQNWEAATAAHAAGDNAFDAGDYQSALAYYSRAAAIYPRFAGYRTNVDRARGAIAGQAGDNAFNAKDYQTALNDYLQASAIRPEFQGYRDDIARTRGTIAYTAGADAYMHGDYATALKLFREADHDYPFKRWHDLIDITQQVLRDQQADAANRQAAARAAAAQQVAAQRDAVRRAAEQVAAEQAATNDVQMEARKLASIGDEQKRDSDGSGGGGLSLKSADDTPAQPAAPNGGAGQGSAGGADAFGRRSTPVDPQLGGAAPSQTFDAKDASGQASSAANSGAAAIGATPGGAPPLSDEAAAAQARCQMDEKGCTPGKSIVVDKAAGQTPDASALHAGIPAGARSDPEVIRDEAIFKHYETVRRDAEGRAADIQKQIDTAKGDKSILLAQKQTFLNEAADAKSGQATTVTQLKEHLVTINQPWQEAPPPPPTDPKAPK